MKRSVCIIKYVDEEWENDASNNPYPVPYYVGFCGSTAYSTGNSWEFFVKQLDSEKATCDECIDAYVLVLLGKVP